MPNSTRRRIGNRAASLAMMHENTRSRSAAASGGTPSLARDVRLVGLACAFPEVTSPLGGE